MQRRCLDWWLVAALSGWKQMERAEEEEVASSTVYILHSTFYTDTRVTLFSYNTNVIMLMLLLLLVY